MDIDKQSAGEHLLGLPVLKEEELYSQKRRKSTWLFFSAIIIGLLPAALVWVWMHGRSASAGFKYYKTPMPQFPTEIRTFEWDYTMTGLRSPESEAAWDSLLPYGRGYIFIDDREKYSLPPGEDGVDGQIYSVALYHQLHCLKIIRRDYFNLLEGIYNGTNQDQIRGEAHKQILNSHNRHCMDYIRQTLECSADLSIEWERTEPDGTRFQVDGMHIPHECKSKTAIEDFMAEQKAVVARQRQVKR